MLSNPFHPSEFLKELMEDYSISAYRLAKETFIPQSRISAILKGDRSITPDTAVRLGRYFGTSAQYWLNLQSSYDLSHCTVDHLEDIHPLAMMPTPTQPLARVTT
jgi:addiction module HigA family antidote